MKIFLVWSGARSFEIATVLHDFLQRMIQAVKPFFSHEIEKGARWANEIDAALEGTRFGIVCLTPDNLASTWVHYETGALSKTKDALIWTYLAGLNKSDVPQPLGKFQHTLATKEETLKLVKTINKHLNDVGSESLSEQILEENFELFWPILDQKLKAAMSINSDEEARSDDVPRKQEAMLEEILELVRNQQRQWNESSDKVVTIGAKKVTAVSFMLPNEPRTADGSLKKPAEVITTYSQIFFELFGAKINQEPCENGTEVRISFLTPLERGLVTKGFNLAEKASGWRPSSFTVLKVSVQ